MQPRVAAFTDTYLPTVNGATYTVRTWRERWQARGGRMDVVYPDADYEPDPGEHPVASLDFPFYEGYRLALPHTPRGVVTPDVVHAHSPFAVGLAGYRYARRQDAPFVVSYHTPTSEYVEYLAPDALVAPLERASERWERFFLDRADLVLAPSERTCAHVRDLGVTTSVEALSNGVDVEFFAPTESAGFRERHGLGDGPLVGYTGRHGYEKRLRDLVDAVAGLDATLVVGGDGPARDDLEARARERDVDARFLGFLDREELPAFYSALDVFAFPSPVETEGLVALEANACGTPVVGADAGALVETVDDGETGYHYPVGDVDAFRDAIRRALDERASLSEACVARREEVSVSRAIDRLEAAYARVLD
ncbi:glycosyltransferase [Halarchaeum sp. CBA1220]|uniref:glycosyltransferase n=1 Tax=Halarchaeum sp. CBA1220 TaxID=1853682 RepID=UPI000F3A9DA0|nr:glycosyltransferase [Halarchaeum sp. CBA1220]QLC34024.1 glycosyltransferase [Halarchaeum sp. CBA1220]